MHTSNDYIYVLMPSVSLLFLAGLLAFVFRGLFRCGQHVGTSADGADREPAADDLAERGQVGNDAVERLRAAQGDAEAGHHFVEDQHAAVLGTQLAQGAEEGRRRRARSTSRNSRLHGPSLRP